MDFDWVRRFAEEEIPFNKMLGLKVLDLQPGQARLLLPFRESFIGDPHRPALHGGVISFLIDTCGGMAVFTKIEEGDRCSTVDLRVDYLRPGAPEDLTAEAKVVRAGNRVAVTNIWVTQQSYEQPVAEGKAVYNLKRASEG